MSPESFLAVPCGGSESYPDPVSFPEVFLVVFGERPVRHMTGDFHCKDGRQEVEWKPDLSAASLNVQPAARPSHCQQAQLGWALGRLVQWGLHVFVTAGVSLRRVPGCAWGTQAVLVLLSKAQAAKERNILTLQEVKLLNTLAANMKYRRRPGHVEAFVTKDVKYITNSLTNYLFLHKSKNEMYIFWNNN